MNRAIVRAVWIVAILPLLLHANYLLKNDLLKLEAEQRIQEIGQELQTKTGISAYVIATNEHFEQGYNLVEYAKQYEANMSKPYVLFIFAPYATITAHSEVRGRVGIIPSDDTLRKHYSADKVRDAAIDIVAVKDSNTDEDKFNIGVLQGYSELAVNIADSKDIALQSAIPDEMGLMLTILRVLVYSGSLALLWIFVFRSLWMRIKNGKQ